jgi:hypothetical protein
MMLFGSPAREAAFFTAYDELLERWGVPVEGLRLGSDFGTTHVNVCGPIGAPPVVLLATPVAACRMVLRRSSPATC